MAEAPPPPPPPMAIDGAQIDAALSSSSHITRRELLARRSRRLKQLSRFYRSHYWALTEELKSRYKDYCWKYGKSPFRKDEKKGKQTDGEENSANGNEKLGLEDGGQVESDLEIRKCTVGVCNDKAMALTRFCRQHILLDHKQTLYKSCAFIIKRTNGRFTYCGKPVLRSTVPLFCPSHFERAESYVVRDLRKAGLNVSYPNKVAPKLHTVVSQFLRQIQKKRMAETKKISKNQIKEVKSSQPS